MGSCISKCIQSKERVKEKEQETDNIAKDKGVVSQVLVTNEVLSPRSTVIQQQPRSPPSSSCTSLASFSSTTEKSISCSTSSLSSASSCPSSKDKSFSNEFLLSCVKENPQIIIRKETLKKPNVQIYSPSSLDKVQRQKTKVTSVTTHSQREVVGSTPQKRVRLSSHNQPRQTRINPMRLPSPSPSRRFVVNNDERNLMRPPSPLRTPSPSRRFVNCNDDRNSLYYKRKASNSGAYSQFGKEKESIRQLSPSNNSKSKSGTSTCKQTCTYRVGSKIDEFEVAKTMAKQDLDVQIEDIDNPLITLDCFIFL
ncbi:uncharacterized protein LOC124918433 [Impatiens glandulifera]|uniref:uncharacterized protein LOC124918433 n=1 Tax=Impatiens glandulifera TaxID=253017 RepID=UPI001FB184BE|nr:uncharacterized protein LOC124918433 [Impatiens glandulifera]